MQMQKPSRNIAIDNEKPELRYITRAVYLCEFTLEKRRIPRRFGTHLRFDWTPLHLIMDIYTFLKNQTSCTDCEQGASRASLDGLHLAASWIRE
jgi:hypothetical protein